MGILISNQSKVIIQGITGREGSVRTKYMKEYGTKVIGGTSPGKKGTRFMASPSIIRLRKLPENRVRLTLALSLCRAVF